MEAALSLGSRPKPSYFPLSVEILGVKVKGLRTWSIWQHGKGVLPSSHSPPSPNDPFCLLLFLQKKGKKLMLTYAFLKPKWKYLHLGGGKSLAVQQHPGNWFCVQNLYLFNNGIRKKTQQSWDRIWGRSTGGIILKYASFFKESCLVKSLRLEKTYKTTKFIMYYLQISQKPKTKRFSKVLW